LGGILDKGEANLYEYVNNLTYFVNSTSNPTALMLGEEKKKRKEREKKKISGEERKGKGGGGIEALAQVARARP